MKTISSISFILMTWFLLTTGCKNWGEQDNIENEIENGHQGDQSVLIGAIRWDAWVSSRSSEGLAVERSLSPEKYHFRLPFYSKILEPGSPYEDIFLDQGFNTETTGSDPAGWVVSEPDGTSVSVVEVPGANDKSVHLHDESASDAPKMSYTFSPQTGKTIVEWDWKETVAGRWSQAVLVNSAGQVAVDIRTRVKAGIKELIYIAPDASFQAIETIADDAWYAVKIEADPGAGTVDIYVDGILKTTTPFRNATESIGLLRFATNGSLISDLYIDNVKVKVNHEGISVKIDGATRDVVDQEIQFAKEAGIDYWAFVYYPTGPLSLARELYLSSSLKDQVSWCAIIEGHFRTPSFGENLQVLIERFKEPNYQKVMNERPLVYFFRTPSVEEVNQLKEETKNAGLPSPYIVIMKFPADDAVIAAREVGADAVSRYARSGTDGISYAALASAEKSQWQSYADAGAPQINLVPTVTTGWDKRPRFDNPVPWEPDYEKFENMWVQQATPQEIAGHLTEAIQWINEHPDHAPARTAIIYAWNEFDEGGWICPTLSPEGGTDDSRIKAVKDLLK